MGAGDLNEPKQRDKMPKFLGSNLQVATGWMAVYIGGFAVILTVLTLLFR
jgi:hypothetical protein